MKLVMFDIDGTLYRTETSFFPAVQEFATRHAFPSPDEQFLRGFIGENGDHWRAWIEQLQLGQPTDELLQEFNLIEKKLVQERGQLYPGAADVVRELALDGWQLGICSNAPAWYPEVILTGAGIRDLFTVVRVPRLPMETKSVMLCQVWNELHPERCAMVGDRADDMRAARAGGFLGIGAMYGWAPDELDHADVRVHDITEVPAALAAYATAAKEPKAAPAPVTAEPVHEVAPEPQPVIAAPEPEVAVTAEPAATPEPIQKTPVIEQPAIVPAPPVQKPPTPEPVSAAPGVSEPAEPVPAARRSWNPFHRREDKSR